MAESSLPPVLALDVDGVCLPYLPNEMPRPICPEGFTEARGFGFDLWVPDHLVHSLPVLAERFEVAWATDWQEMANRDVSPLFGLPKDLPVLARRPVTRGWWKTAAVLDYAQGRALAWVDDDITSSARTRVATTHPGRGLCIKPDRWTGITERQVMTLHRFADKHGAT